MIIRKLKYLLLVVVLLALSVPLGARAAFDDVTAPVTSGVPPQIVLPVDSSIYTLTDFSKVVSFIVNSDNVSFTMLPGSSLQLISADLKTFNISGSGTCNVEMGCNSVNSGIIVQCTVATTLTITPQSTVCNFGGSGGSSGGNSSGSSAPSSPSTPVGQSTTPAVPVVAPAAPSAPVIVVPATPISVPVAMPSSQVEINSPVIASYQPGETLKFNYQYTNEETKAAKVKVVRQLLNSAGKVVKTSTATQTLKTGSTFVGLVKDVFDKKLPAGDYIIKVKVLNATNNQVLDENSFTVAVEPLKVKFVTLGEVVSASSPLTFDAVALVKVKAEIILPANIKLKYAYTNNTDVKQNILMAREILDANGNVVLAVKPGKWTMVPGETDSMNFVQAIPGSLSAGSYTIRVRAYDSKTNEVLAENSLGFVVELK